MGRGFFIPYLRVESATHGKPASVPLRSPFLSHSLSYSLSLFYNRPRDPGEREKFLFFQSVTHLAHIELDGKSQTRYRIPSSIFIFQFNRYEDNKIAAVSVYQFSV